MTLKGYSEQNPKCKFKYYLLQASMHGHNKVLQPWHSNVPDIVKFP